MCGWDVLRTGVTVEYSSGAVLRNAIRANKSGQCLIDGDSGGPAYTVRSDGKVVARGIVSGGGGGGGDNWGGALDPCRGFFTDIKLAEKAFPGIVRTS